MQIEIKRKYTNEVIFSHDCENNTIIKTLEEAIKSGANLRGANLSCANLSCANLSGADLGGANLSCANLRGANLSGADLSGANLSCANLRGANLSGANLSGANLSGVDISGANLSYADLGGANLSGADLSDVKTNYSTTGYYLSCPESGEFIAYKKCKNDVIVTLKILADAKRSSATTLKCRASKVEVMALSKGNKAISQHDSNFTYKVGQIIEINDFDDNRWNECSTGIHFFMNKEAAENYD
jgi:hypothetical protein